MIDFLKNIDWLFLTQIIILILLWQVFKYLLKSYKQFENFSNLDKETVLNEPSNFIEHAIANETILYKALVFILGLFAISGCFAILCSIFLGFNQLLKMPGLQGFWSSLIFYSTVLLFIFLIVHWTIDNLKDRRQLTDYDKLKRYLRLREAIDITLQLRFAKLEKSFLPKANLSFSDLAGADLSCSD